MNENTKAVDVLAQAGGVMAVMDRMCGDASGKGPTELGQAYAAHAAVKELIEENAAMRELLRIQDEAMTAYRELVEHRNRQIYALGGEL